MIPISVPMFFIIYIYSWFIVLIILWLREQWRTYISDWKRDRNNHFQCDNCHFTFIEKYSTICRCPRCNEISIARQERPF